MPRRAQPVCPLNWELFLVEVSAILRGHGLEKTLIRDGDVMDINARQAAGVYVRHYLHPEDERSVQECLDIHDVIDVLQAKVERRRSARKATALEDLLRIKIEQYDTAERFTEDFAEKLSLLKLCGFPVTVELKLEWLLRAIMDGAPISYDRIAHTPSIGYEEALQQIAGIPSSFIVRRKEHDLGHQDGIIINPSKLFRRSIVCHTQTAGAPNSMQGLRKVIVLDSGATEHIFCNKDLLTDVFKTSTPTELITASRMKVLARLKGTLKLLSGEISCVIKNVWYASYMGVNLLSERKLVQNGGFIMRDSKSCVVFDRAGKIMLRASASDQLQGLYVVDQQNEYSDTMALTKLAYKTLSNSYGVNDLATPPGIPANTEPKGNSIP